MTIAPTSPQWGATYTLKSAAGVSAVFNNSAAAEYVGMLDPEQCSGLDSADVRESFAELVEADGGEHGNFWLGRRPVVLGGLIRAGSVTERGEKISRLKQAALALRSDATLTWKVEGGTETFIKVRRNQPLRVTGGFQKQFQLSLVAADPRIYSTAQHAISYGNATKNVLQEFSNAGDSDSPPEFIKITGPGTTFTIELNGLKIVLATTIAAGHYIIINPATTSVLLDGATNAYSSITRAETTWSFIQPGSNTFKWTCASGNTSATKVEVSYRDAWQ